MRMLPIALTFAGLCVFQAPAVAQSTAAPQSRQGDPLEMLLGIGDELDLTSEQIRRLREIQGDLEERNRPLVDRLVEVQRQVRAQLVRTDTSGGSLNGPTAEHLEIARAPMRRIHVNNIEAMERVGRILTRSQKRIAAELLDLPGVDRRWGRGRRR